MKPILLACAFLALPLIAQAQTATDSGTLTTADKGHIALQYGPTCSMSALQASKNSDGTITWIGAKTYGLGMALTLSVWPYQGAYKLHLSAVALAALGSPGSPTGVAVSGIAGLTIGYGGYGSVPLFGIGVGFPVVVTAGSAIPREPEILVTIGLANLLSEFGVTP